MGHLGSCKTTITTSTDDASHILPKLQRDSIGGAEMEGFIEEMMLEFDRIRGHFIALYNDEASSDGASLPDSVASTVSDTDSHHAIEEEIIFESLEEDVNSIQVLRNEAAAIFPDTKVDANICAMQLNFSHIGPELLQAYDNETNVTLLISFEYTNSTRVPHCIIQGKITALSTHILSIAQSFVDERWQQIRPDSQSTVKSIVHHPKLAFLGDSERLSSALNTVSSKKRYSPLASALFLYAHDMNIRDALLAMMERGITLRQDTNTNFIFHPRPNIISELITYLLLRAFKLSQCCIICDDVMHIDPKQYPRTKTHDLFQHLYTDENLTHLKLCTKGRCQFSYAELGASYSLSPEVTPCSILEDCKVNPEIVDLLMSMFYSSLKGYRPELSCAPFPAQYEHDGTRGFERLRLDLETIPPISKLATLSSEEELKKVIGSKSYALMAFILSTRRPILVRLPEKRRISGVSTPFQFLMLMDSPRRTRKFNALTKKYGSYFAVHGSDSWNWHSILRHGLAVLSGTELESHGAVFGRGIYCSNLFEVSMGYASRGASWPNSEFFREQLSALTLLQVAKLPGVQTSPNPHYVIDNPDAVRTCFFLFYTTQGTDYTVDVDRLSLHEFVQNSVMCDDTDDGEDGEYWRRDDWS